MSVMVLPNMKIADSFVAIDFETANDSRDSACSIALIKVIGTQIVERTHFFIRPPRREFRFTYLHGISWENVANEPTFGELWPRLAKILADVEFIAAHNAGFDRSVLMACCRVNGLTPPPLNFLCTVRLAKTAWRLHPATLPDVCKHLGIPLNHHKAESDAEACAKIVIAAKQKGVPLVFMGQYQGRSAKVV